MRLPMPALSHTVLRLQKRVPLTISRGTSTHSELLWIRWNEDGCEGWGEAAPFAIDAQPQRLDTLLAALEAQRPWLEQSSAWSRDEVERRLWTAAAPSALIAGINQAMHDWMGKRLGQPVWRLLGLSGEPGPLTSVTIGISSPEAARTRARQWLEVGDVRAFKVKLGAPAGITADQAMFEAVREAIPAGARVSVDANGGWNPPDAVVMARWLGERGVDHLEQPLAAGKEEHLAALQAASPVPILVDESCKTAADIPALAGKVAGINIKLMKCGGLDGALRLVHAARAHGMKILVGCYGSTALGNTCAATLGPLVDYLDLDSHLNLSADPFAGAILRGGRLQLPTTPGFGLIHD